MQSTTTVLLEEDFETGSAPLWSNPGNVWRVVGGELRRTDLTVIDSAHAIYNGAGALDWKDYRFECDFRILSPTQGSNEIAFIFRFQDDDNCYKLSFFWVNGGYTPNMQLIRVVQGSVIQVVPKTDWTLVGPLHHVAVAVAGGRLDVFVDGYPVYNGADGAPETGTVGLVAEHIEAGFDNVRVSPLPPDPPPRPPVPVLYSLEPYEGSYHQGIVLHGADFGSSRDAARGAVLFGSLPALVESWGPDTVRVRVPETAYSIVRVAAFDQVSQSADQRFRILPPRVWSANPETTSPGDIVTLSGEHFGFAQGREGKVRVAGAEAGVVAWSDNQVRFIMPDVPGRSAKVTLSTVAGEDDAAVTVLSPAAVTCTVQPSQLALGQGLTVSGVLTTRNQAPLAGKILFVGMVSPGGETHTVDHLITDPAGKYELVVSPDQLPYPLSQPGTWQAAVWRPEDEHYRDASALSSFFNVAPIKAALVAEASPGAVVARNGIAEIHGRVWLSPGTLAARTFLEGATITGLVVSPPGSVSPWEAPITNSEFHGPAVRLNQVGLWRFTAAFEGSKSVLPSDVDVVEVQAVAAAGYAVVVAGRVPSAEGMEEHTRTTDGVVASLVRSGFAPENVLYLNGGVPPPPSAAAPFADKSSVRQAITQWAADRMAEAPAPLYLVWVNHGDVVDGTGRFHLSDRIGQGPDGFVTPAELDAWLGQLEAELDARNPLETAGLPIVFVYGACHSGSFIPTLSRPGKRRVLVASSDTYEVSYRGPADRLPRDGEFFVTRFFEHAADGLSLREAFLLASQEIREYTRDREAGPSNGRGQNRYFDGALQHPQLDDDGDGVAEAAPLVHDGGLAARLWLSGIPPDGGQAPLTITYHTGDFYLSPGDPDPLFGIFVTDPSRLGRVWLEVRTPAYAQPPAGLTESLQRSQAFPIVFPSGLIGTFLWWTNYTRADFAGFVQPGEYQVFYFVEDVSGRLAPVQSSRVFRNRAGNRPPDPFSLLKPAADSRVDVYPCFQWEAAVDPDGDRVAYSLMLSTSPQFPTLGTQVCDVDDSLLFAGRNLVLKDGTEYFWKVVARDVYGATRQCQDVFRFRTDAVNDVFGSMLVRLFDGSSGDRVLDATVVVEPDTLLPMTAKGAFVGLGLPLESDYWLTVVAPGYRQPESRQVLIRSPEEPALVDYYLYRPGDFDEDGRMGMIDLFTFSREWQESPAGGADLNQDGSCDEADLFLWLQNKAIWKGRTPGR